MLPKELQLKALHTGVKLALKLASIKNKPAELEEIDDASLEVANQIDKTGGRFLEAARHAQTVYAKTNDPIERGDALVLLIRQRTNRTEFAEARRLIEKDAPKVVMDVPVEGTPSPRLRLQAMIENRRGWLEEYEMGPKPAIRSFERARSLLLDIEEVNWTDEMRELWRTTTHFLGRQYFLLGELGFDSEISFEKARNSFLRDLSDAQMRRRAGAAISPDNEAYQHAWLTRCSLKLGRVDDARDHLSQAEVGFRGAEQQLGRRGPTGHYHLVAGEFDLSIDREFDAIGHFDIAKDIFTYDEPDNKLGLVNANLGLAAVHYKLREFRSAGNALMEAKKAQPAAALRVGLIKATAITSKLFY